MNDNNKLCNINIGEWAKIVEILPSCLIKRRLIDIGLISGTKVKCLYENTGKDMKAYLIRGAVIAIRNVDSSKITVERAIKI